MWRNEYLEVLCKENHWTGRKYTAKQVEEFYQQIPPEAYLSKFSFGKNQGYAFAIKSVPPNTETRAVVTLMSHIREATSDFVGDFLVSIGDGIHEPIDSGGPSSEVPIVAFGKEVNDEYSLLMPDPDFLRSYGEQDFQLWVDEISEVIPWEKKIPKVFWRGSTTGYQMNVPHFGDRLRFRLVTASHELSSPNQVDVYYSGFKQIEDPDVVATIKSKGLVRDKVDFKEFYHYRYLIEIDGNSCPWSFLRKLRMNSVVLRVESSRMQWYYPLLKPWEHYIPVKNDLSDYKEKIDWVFSHEEECKQIASNGSALARKINMELGIGYTTCVLANIFSGFVG